MKRFQIVILIFALIFSLCACNTVSDKESAIPGEGTSGGAQAVYGTVEVCETISDTEESSYQISAQFLSSDFSGISQVLSDKIKADWDEYDRMTEAERLFSSHIWGTVYLETDTWTETEKAVGFSVHNPLESIDWLTKTGYIGSEGSDPENPVKHVKVSAYASRDLSSLRITAGYSSQETKVTLRAELKATDESLTMGYTHKGYTEFEQETSVTASGIPVLIVSSDITNNTGYYVNAFWSYEVFWAKDNVFYTLGVSGAKVDQVQIEAVLQQILEAI